MTRGRDLPKLNSNPTHPHVTNALPLPLHLVEDLISSKRSRCVWNNGVFSSLCRIGASLGYRVGCYSLAAKLSVVYRLRIV